MWKENIVKYKRKGQSAGIRGKVFWINDKTAHNPVDWLEIIYEDL